MPDLYRPTSDVATAHRSYWSASCRAGSRAVSHRALSRRPGVARLSTELAGHWKSFVRGTVACRASFPQLHDRGQPRTFRCVRVLSSPAVGVIAFRTGHGGGLLPVRRLARPVGVVALASASARVLASPRRGHW